VSEADRCAFTDLLKESCAHCHPERFPKPQMLRSHMAAATLGQPQYGPWFVARFDSECAGPCGGRIGEGDPARSDGEGGWLCQLCGGTAR